MNIKVTGLIEKHGMVYELVCRIFNGCEIRVDPFVTFAVREMLEEEKRAMVGKNYIMEDFQVAKDGCHLPHRFDLNLDSENSTGSVEDCLTCIEMQIDKSVAGELRALRSQISVFLKDHIRLSWLESNRVSLVALQGDDPDGEPTVRLWQCDNVTIEKARSSMREAIDAAMEK